MSLNIAVFVPEGITIVSDTLAFLKTNGDDGFPSSAQRTFCIDNRYILSFTGCNYINGMPYGYYVNSFLSTYYSVTIKSDTHIAQMDYMKTEEFSDYYSHRYKIEAKNAEIKLVYNYEKSTACGQSGVTIQGATTLFLANLKRIYKLEDEKKMIKG